MRILVLSDSHGAVDNMARFVELTQPDHILHLGDCVRDADALHRQFPRIPMVTVPGNCDYGSADEPEKLIELGTRRILMMHGHTRGVKYGLDRARYAAQEAGADVLLFGHTHRPLVDRDGALHILNPGTCGRGGVFTCGVITADAAQLECATRWL